MIIARAFLYNLNITVCSCILPIIVGAIYLSIAKKKPEKKRIAPIISLIPESISPYVAVAVMCIIYSWQRTNAGLFSISKKLLVTLPLTICFIGYIPKRQNRNYSLKKDLIVNSLGLFSTVFMWSLTVDNFFAMDRGLGNYVYSLVLYNNYKNSVVVLAELILIPFLFVLILKGAKYWVEFHLLRNDAPKEKVKSLNHDETSGGVVMDNKSKVVSALLAFFLGTTGAHRYYLGYKKQGIIQTCGFISLVIGYAMYIPAMMDGSTGMLLFSALFLLYGAGIGIWAFIDFIRILTGGLTPADGISYTENRPAQVQVIQPTLNVNANAAALEKLAKLHEQGILTDEEFQQKKTELLAKM